MKVLLLGCGHSISRRLCLLSQEPHRASILRVNPGVDYDPIEHGEFLIPPERERWPDGVELRTWDINPDARPTRIVDLDTPWREWFAPDPVSGDLGEVFHDYDFHQYDEVHAYEVLEHLGRQGNMRTFFNTFVGIWHLLKPGGLLFATTPHWQSEWAWGDPGHRRIISAASLVFLNVDEYMAQLGKTAMSDYRDLLRPANFEIVAINSPHAPGRTPDQFMFCLRAL